MRATLPGFTLLLTSLVSVGLAAQCDVGADAGADVLVCFEDNTVSLNGSVFGAGVLGYSWSPSTGLSDPNSLTPTVFLDGTPRTYTLTSQGFDPANNEIINGDFNLGNTGFSSDYDLGTGGAFGLLSAEGQYAISNNAGNTHTNFAACNDHTGGGNMMVVNGSSVAGDEVWCQTITVTPGTDYAFSAWVTSVISSNPARLQFSINGALIGSTFAVSSATCSWQEFNELWTATNSSAEICITNQNTAGSGNDFALDDLFFGEVCEATDEVMIDVLTVEAIAPATIELPCDGQVTIDASASTSGPGMFYNWFTSSGNIVSGFGTPVVNVNAPGEYTLEVIFDNGITFCSDVVTVTVTDDLLPAVAVASVNGLIDCNNPTLQLSGAGSSTGADWTYSWTTVDGEIISGETTLTPTVAAGGTYEIVVFNPVSGCTAIEEVTVTADLAPPSAAIAPSAGIPCGATGITLDGSPSTGGAGTTYSWSTMDGNIASGGTGTMPLVTATGTYQLVVRQGANGCTDTASIVITPEASDLMVNIAVPDTLYCDPAPIDLNGSGSSAGANIAYHWTTSDGNILAGGNSPSPTVDEPGTYVLMVQDTAAGCSREDSVVVVENLTPPALSLAVPDTLTCNTGSAVLIASSNPGVNYSWSTTDGVIQTGQGSDSLVVIASGEYFLTVRDTVSGCTATDTVSVAENVALPLVDAGAADTLTCSMLAVQLDGSNSSTGPSFVYAWTTQGGNIVSGAGTQVPVVDAAGLYFLEVTNSATGCAARDTVQLASDDEAPVISIVAGGNLDCTMPTQMLNASQSSSGGNYLFAWSTTSGSFVAGSQTLTPEVEAAGTYVLTVTDTVNTCVTVDSVTITQDTVRPAVAAGPDFRLDCYQPTDTLVSLGSDTGPGFDFSWSTTNGSFIDAPTTPNPRVGAAGTYVLLILNPANGCVNSDTVTVTESFLEPQASAGPDAVINCRDSVLTLGETPFDPALEYTWVTADGNIRGGTSSNQIVVDAGGNYRFTALNPDNGCFAEDSILITENLAAPTATIAPPEELDCVVESVTLDAGGSSFGAPFMVNWSTATGNIVSGAGGLSPSIDAPSNYTLLIENTDNFCVDSARVTVTEDVDFPAVEAGDSLEINCRFPQVELSAAGSDTSGNLTLLWTTSDGNFLGDPGGFSPEIDAAGTYFLTVRNPANNCAATDSVVVTSDFMRPSINGGPNVTLTCDNPTLVLGRDSITPGYQYLWTTFSGNIIDGGSGPTVTVAGPGLYSLRVTDFGNGCRGVDNVTVRIDTLSPTVSIADPVVLNCRDTIIALTGQAAAGLEYTWMTSSGSLAGPTDEVETMVVAPGDYLLEVVDPTNGCRSAASTTVAQNIAPPVFTLAPAAALTCLDTLREIQADELGPDFAYSWTSADGNILTGAAAPSPTVDEPGTYLLTVTNRTNFCVARDSLLLAENIVAPQLSIAPPATLTCAEDTVALLAQTDLAPAGVGIVWTTTDGVVTSGATTLSPGVSAPGTYRLVLINQENGCATADEVMVAQNVVLPVIDLAGTVDLGCTEDDFSLAALATGNGPLSYTWSTENGSIVSGGLTLAPVINGVGTYQLVVTDTNNGCLDSASVIADQNLLLDFAFTQRSPNCERIDGTLLFGDVDGGTQPFRYSVDGGNTFRSEPVFQGLDPDNYVLVVQDANGCEVERGTSIVPAPVFELAISENAIIDFGDFYQVDARINFPLSAVDTIIWTPARGLDCTDCLNPRAAPQETQSYRLRVETVDGCVAEDFLTIIVNEENPVYFPTAFSPNGDGVNDTFIPFASLTRVARITSMQIFDRWGESVFFNEDFAPNDPLAGWDGTLNGKPLNPQVLVYSVEVEFLNGELRLYKGDVSLLR